MLRRVRVCAFLERGIRVLEGLEDALTCLMHFQDALRHVFFQLEQLFLLGVRELSEMAKFRSPFFIESRAHVLKTYLGGNKFGLFLV